MTDMTAFERQLSGEISGLMGPARPVDDLAVFEAATAASRSHRWGFTMFSALKFVAAGVIVALFGGFLLAGVLTTPQSDEMAPAAVTESPSPVSKQAAAFDGTHPYGTKYQPGKSTAEDGVIVKRGDGYEFRLELKTVSDPRLAGTWRNIFNEDAYLTDASSEWTGVWTRATRIDNAEGSWLGELTGYRDPDDNRWHHQGILTGKGAYEGLAAIVFIDDNGIQSKTYSLHGLIFPGELPEAPEYPEPAD